MLTAPLLKAAELAELLQIPVSSVYHLAEAHELPSIRVGRRMRFDRESVVKWLQERSQM
jgi:excisionase family DNA binding protein